MSQKTPMFFNHDLFGVWELQYGKITFSNIQLCIFQSWLFILSHDPFLTQTEFLLFQSKDFIIENNKKEWNQL